MTLIPCPRCRLWHEPGRPETVVRDVNAEVIAEFVAVVFG